MSGAGLALAGLARFKGGLFCCYSVLFLFVCSSSFLLHVHGVEEPFLPPLVYTAPQDSFIVHRILLEVGLPLLSEALMAVGFPFL